MSTLPEAGIRFLPGDIVELVESGYGAVVLTTELHGDSDGWETVHMVSIGATFQRHFPTELRLTQRGPENGRYFE